MAQQTLELADDCRLVENILKEKEVSCDVDLSYEGNSRVNFKHNSRRRYNNMGYPFLHAQEIYSRVLPENRTYLALNELVRQKKVETAAHDGLFWYSWALA